MGCSTSKSGGSGLSLADADAIDAGMASFKIVVIGDQSVGKTCLVSRFVHEAFPDDTRATIGAAFATKDVPCKTRKGASRVRCQLWDTSGQERYRAITRSFFRGAAGAVLVFDVTDKRSLESIKYWRGQFGAECPDAAILLVGNKCDLVEEREVTTEEGRAVAADTVDASGAKRVAAGYVETSARTGTAVELAFTSIAQMIVNNTQHIAIPVGTGLASL